MTDFLSPLDGGERFVLALVGIVMLTTMLIPVASVGFASWRKVREREAAAALVHDMLARGFTTEEIERVLAGAGLGTSGPQKHGHAFSHAPKHAFWSCCGPRRSG